MTAWTTVQGDQKPLPLDNVTSQFTVWENRNPRELEIHEDPADPTSPTRTVWEYEQRSYTKEEYDQLHSPVTQVIMQQLSAMELQIAELTD